MGPMSGGTRLTIYGEHVNSGSDVQAFLDNIPCQIILKESNRLECRTGGFKRRDKLRVILKLDQSERIYEPGFSCVDNPIIIFNKDEPVRGIAAGGLKTTVEGRNFDVIQEPIMYVLLNGSKHTSTCDISSNDFMVCYTPIFDEEFGFYEVNKEDLTVRLQYGFVLDTIDYFGFNNSSYDPTFILYPNPQFDPFDDDVKEYKSDYLTINGRNLNDAADEMEFEVLIGNATCNITSISRSQLTCRPPQIQPVEVDDNGNIDPTKLPRVKVKIGQHLVYMIGRIRYETTYGGLYWALQKEQVVIIAVIPLVTIIGIVGLVGYFLRKHYRRTYLQKSEMDEFFIGNQSKDNDEQTEFSLAERSAYDKDRYEIDNDAFVINESSILGSGEFGMVFRGTVKRSGEVAVKTVNPQKIHKTTLKGLLSEIKLLAFIGQHSNIIDLIGANTSDLKNGKVFIFLELCELGSLLKYLREMRPAVGTQEQTESVNENICAGHLYGNQNFEMTSLHEPSLDISQYLDLHRWSKEICSAMAYLASKHVVHADLATRNILVNSNKEAKICDFGLSRRMYNYANYVKQQQEPLPWKWMSPEALRLMQFNEKSDVWAYGVTLWEIYTLGDTPYSGLSWDMNFAALLENGFRLNEPTYNQNGMFEVMKKCWTTNPSGRPVFVEILESLN